METEWLYRVALTLIPDLGPVCAKALTDHFGSATDIFRARPKDIASVNGIGEARSAALRRWKDFRLAEKELDYIGTQSIQPLFLTDDAYPKRLLNCYDPPTVLYHRGNADLNTARIVSIVGTRNHSEYGKNITRELVAGLQPHGVLVVSGLAFGIDAIAHTTCLEHSMPTVGVLAHGMGTLYPQQHRGLSQAMVQNGGLLTEFSWMTLPDKHNFPRRNRLVAGMADATVVIETAPKGGSMITADLAHSYHRDLFAVPGRLTDLRSRGCLQLVKDNKAILYTGVAQLLDTMGWTDKKPLKQPPQRSMFQQLTEDEKRIIAMLQQKPLAIDELCTKSGLPASAVAAAMLNLELGNVVGSLPGKIYELL